MNLALQAEPAEPSSEERLSPEQLLSYSAPMLGYSFVQMLFTLYLMKFATDTLLIAPAAMGTVFFIGRIWDASSDPLAGYGSDRTRTRLGRRRPWMMAAAPLLLLAPVAMWAPPMRWWETPAEVRESASSRAGTWPAQITTESTSRVRGSPRQSSPQMTPRGSQTSSARSSLIAGQN